ncbi:MAG: hypothetical protein WCP17_03515 [bacterium]
MQNVNPSFQGVNMTGIYYVLTVLPIWATAAILLGMLAVLIVGRDILEGKPYNVAYSSAIGDVGLVMGVLIAATTLQRGGVFIPQFLEDGALHVFVFLWTVIVGMIVCRKTIDSRDGQAMDVFHDVVIAPTFAFLSFFLVPIVYYNGSTSEKMGLAFFVMLWATLVAFDVRHKRMNQREWLKNHGVKLRK